MESGRPVTPTSNDTSEEMRNLIEQINMRFQVVELNMNLMLNPINASFTKIFNQLDTLNTLVDRVNKLEEKVNRHLKAGMEEKEDPNRVGNELTQKITPLLQIMKNQAQEKEKEKEAHKELSLSPVPDQPSTSNQTAKPKKTSAELPASNSVFKLSEYFTYFKKLIYNLNHFSFKTPKIKYISHYAFNKAIIHQGTPSNVVKALYQHGLIQSIYPSASLEEIAELPEPLKRAVKTYFGIVTQHMVFIRCYSTIAEITPDKFYHPINLIRLGTTRKPFEHSVEPKEDIDDDEEFMETISRIRSQDYHIIFQEMNRILATEDEAAWVYFSGPTTLIYSSGRNTRNINQFNQFYDKIKNNKFENSIETKKRICQLLAEYATHKCNYCDERSPERRDFEDPIMDMSVI